MLGLGGHLPHVDGRGFLSRAAESPRQSGQREQSVPILRILSIPTNHHQAAHAAGNSSGDY